MDNTFKPQDVETARNVLWYFGDSERGWQPGSFTESLIKTVCKADMENISRLSRGFPVLVSMVNTAKTYMNGMQLLQEFADNEGRGNE